MATQRNLLLLIVLFLLLLLKTGCNDLSRATMAMQSPPSYCPFPPTLAKDTVQRSIQSNNGNATSSFLLSFSSYSCQRHGATIYPEQQWQRNFLLLIVLFLLLLLKTRCNDLSRATMATQPPPSYCPFPPTLAKDRVQRSIQSNNGNATSSFLLSFSSYSC